MEILTWELVRRALPYLLPGIGGFVLGFWMAWTLQGWRVESAKEGEKRAELKLEEYKIAQQKLQIEAYERAEKRRAETIREWSEKYAKLQNDTEIYRRCLAAGKCVGLRPVPNLSQPKLSTALGTHAAGADTIPAAPGPAETPAVLTDCAVTTLRLNALQDDIEKQLK